MAKRGKIEQVSMVQKLGQYIIDGLVAEGGMARILRARSHGAGGVEKVVALKCLKGVMQSDDSYVKMLMEEARITCRMTHKNIGQVYGLEHEGDQYFMVMELIDGINLSQLIDYLCKLKRVFPIEAAVFITMEVCSGLSYAHRMVDETGESLGIVHRDVNPQNICISKEGEVKLIDFGIAKSEAKETQTGTIKGKFNYMSPEQARGDRVDQRTDVFALGAVLYEMLTCHMLYPLSLSDAVLRTKSRMAEFIPIESYMPDIPDKLKRILNKALARGMGQRFSTSRDFLLALTQFSHDGCKVYDSLNLSLLVEKYLKDNANPDFLKKHSPEKIKALSASKEDELENRRTTLMEAPNPTFLQATINDSEDTATSIYTKADVDAALRAGNLAASALNDIVVLDEPHVNLGASGERSMISSALNRSVDLNVVNPSTGSTVMMKMDHVKGKESFVSRIRMRIQAIDERTLIAIAVVLVLIFALILVLSSVVTTQSEGVALPQSGVQEDLMVTLESDPSDAEIFYGDESSHEHTPSQVALSREEVELRKPFYEPLRIRLRDEIGLDHAIFATLTPKEGLVHFVTTPSGAQVFVDGRAKCETPCEAKVPMNRENQIVFRLEGYRESKEIVRWKSEDAEQQVIDVTLSPTP